MNALPCYAERAAREYQRVQDQADNRAAAELDALEEMRGNRGCVETFLCDPNENPDVTGLVSLFLDYGMPLRSKTPSDDKLLTKYEDRRDALTAQFDAWARKRTPMLHTSPLQRWMEAA
ncbi:hypothetical protein CH75_06310 [Dyella jiangningensis]|nr:hypothetical protein CH75_06310 [Dyella jiangningensis]